MILIWLGFAAYAGRAVYYSYHDGSYVRAAFCAMWFLGFVLATWVDVRSWMTGA